MEYPWNMYVSLWKKRDILMETEHSWLGNLKKSRPKNSSNEMFQFHGIYVCDYKIFQ